MDKKELIPGIIMLCGCCIRFLAYYRAGDRIQKKHKNKIQMQFWIYVSNSLLNMCILEWCKLFCEKDGKHFWKNGVEDEREFKNGLFKLEVMQGGEAEFDKYCDSQAPQISENFCELGNDILGHRSIRGPRRGHNIRIRIARKIQTRIDGDAVTTNRDPWTVQMTYQILIYILLFFHLLVLLWS